MVKKILITVPTLGTGGMERSAINFAGQLQKEGYDVKIFLLSSDVIYYDTPADVEIIAGKKRVKDKWLFPFSLLKLRKLCRKFKPDMILSFSGRLSCYVILSLTGLKTPVIPFHRGSPNITYGTVSSILNKHLFPKCKAIVVQTKTAQAIFRDKFKNENVIISPNPIRKMNIDENAEKGNTIVTVSRVVKGKGIEKLIKIFSDCEPEGWKLLIVGDGILMPDMKRLTHELGIENKVEFVGFQKNVDKYLSSASIFAFASESEGFPNALLEGMCAGLPCISFDCPTGPADMILDGENGFLIDMDDEEEYKKKLQLLMSDESLRSQFSQKAKELNRKHHPEKIISRLMSDLDKIL